MTTRRFFKNHFISRTTSNSGFTLIELIAVIVIIGILSRAVVVNVGDVAKRTRSRNAVNIAIADLRYAQEMAMSRRRPVRFVVQSGSNRYYAVYSDNNETVMNSDGQPIDRTFNNDDFKDIYITDTATGGNLTFSDIGRPDVGGGYFTHSSVMSLNNGEYEIYIFGSGLSTFQEGGGRGCGC